MGRAYVYGQGITRYRSFANASWSQINKVAQRGLAQTTYAIGDEKQIALTTGEVITLRIEDFEHDDLASGGKAKITIAMKDLLDDIYRMNSVRTTTGGWNASLLRTETIPMLLSQLPVDLQSVIKPVIKRTTQGDGSTAIQTTTDSLWLFSAIEVGAPNPEAGYIEEGTAYPLFVSDASRIKRLENGSRGAFDYWTRSPDIGPNINFLITNSKGSPWWSSDPTSRYGVCFGFCI